MCCLETNVSLEMVGKRNRNTRKALMQSSYHWWKTLPLAERIVEYHPTSASMLQASVAHVLFESCIVNHGNDMENLTFF